MFDLTIFAPCMATTIVTNETLKLKIFALIRIIFSPSYRRISRFDDTRSHQSFSWYIGQQIFWILCVFIEIYKATSDIYKEMYQVSWHAHMIFRIGRNDHKKVWCIKMIFAMVVVQTSHGNIIFSLNNYYDLLSSYWLTQSQLLSSPGIIHTYTI